MPVTREMEGKAAQVSLHRQAHGAAQGEDAEVEENHRAKGADQRPDHAAVERGVDDLVGAGAEGDEQEQERGPHACPCPG